MNKVNFGKMKIEQIMTFIEGLLCKLEKQQQVFKVVTRQQRMLTVPIYKAKNHLLDSYYYPAVGQYNP